MKKRSDGRYCKQILVGYKSDGTRKMKTVYGKTIKEIEQKVNEIYHQIELDIANNTYERYAGIIKNQINPVFGEILISNIRLNMLQQLINDMSGQYAPATINKTKNVLYQMFKQAVSSQYIIVNPAENLVTPKFYQTDREVIPSAKDYIKKYWGGMLALNADTFYEAYVPENLEFSPYGNRKLNSMCHAWSCTPAFFIRKYFDNAGF